LTKALCSYKMELPKLEKWALKEVNKLNKTHNSFKNSGSRNYHFIIIPTFILKENYINFRPGESFSKYINFEQMHSTFDVFVFKDSTYEGVLYLSDINKVYFSVHDTTKYNASVFNSYSQLANQILKFNPEMVFYPDNSLFICFIKKGKLFIGYTPKQLRMLNFILPFDEFENKFPSFLKELEANKNLTLKKYRTLKNCPNS